VLSDDEPGAAPEHTSLAGHLLCAVPQLQDPNFKRSVVLMLEHGPHGALGLVLNNPMTERVSDIAQGLGLHWVGDEGASIHLAGPVETMRGWVLHDQATWDPNADEILPGVYLTTSLEPITEAGRTIVGTAGSHFLFLLGYAGWEVAQIEGEIAAGSWVAVPFADTASPGAGVDPHWLFNTPADSMWAQALGSIGVDPARLVGMTGASALH